MKKLLFALMVLSCGTGYAATMDTPLPVNVSSFTATNDTKVQLGTTKPGDILEAVIVSSASSVTGGLLTVFDGQGTNASNVIGKVTLTSVQFYPFFVKVSSGVSYSTTGNAAGGVTIIYRQR